MKNSVQRVDDNEMHAELLDTELSLDVVDGQPRVELLIADHLTDGPDVAVYHTPLANILDTFIDDHEPDDLRIVAAFLQDYVGRLNAKLSG